MTIIFTKKSQIFLYSKSIAKFIKILYTIGIAHFYFKQKGAVIMNIILPTQNLRTNRLRIENGILYLRYGQSFQDIMYDLTYFMKGKNFCYYCKKKVPRNQITMDHFYPRCTGGPTIPQNLYPACKKCNTEKANMTYGQFLDYLELTTEEQQKKYRLRINSMKKGLNAIGMYEFPYSWITPVKVSEIHTQIDFANISETKFKKEKAYYKKHHNFKKPIILDRNLYSLDGFYVLFVAKACEVDYIPAIILENVEIHTSNSK